MRWAAYSTAVIVLGGIATSMGVESTARAAHEHGYHVTLAAPVADLPEPPDADVVVDGYRPEHLHAARRFVVVATQGRGDEAALRAALSIDAPYHAFVGSRRKMAALHEKLVAAGIAAAVLERVKAPAGLDLGAITPEEIAMSILAEITVTRRRGQRSAASAAEHGVEQQ